MSADMNFKQSFSHGSFYSIPEVERLGWAKVSRLPVSLRIVLESLLRNLDGKRVRELDVKALASWKPKAERTEEIPFVVSRVLLQDFTGVPLVVDLAAMRTAVERAKKPPKLIEPLVPVDLVIDHSVQVDFARVANALQLNMGIEFTRNRARYEFLKWGMQAFDGLKIVPPGIGIVHQVNLEYLAKGILEQDGMVYPDTLVGTDSHTTMINGLGIVAWGVGGIEAEAAMLGQPVYFLTPDVVGVHLSGKLRAGATATDLVLTVTEMLRKAKVVGKFVEFFGEGTASLSVTDRATLGNMAPEYGATMGFFPVDSRTLEYFRGTGRSDEAVDALASYYKAQGLFGIPKKGAIDYSEELELDLSKVYPSLAGPKRPQDRIDLDKVKDSFARLFAKPVAENGFAKKPEELQRSYRTFDGKELRHGDVLIAAITSCTNTSNPGVLLAAGLLDFKTQPLGKGSDGKDVYIGHIWPTQEEIAALMKLAMDPATFRRLYSNLGETNPLWKKISAAAGQVYSWPKSTYIAEPPFFRDFSMAPGQPGDISAAKGTQLLGVKAVIARSFERIHRSNLVGMGVLPLQLTGTDSAQSLGLKGDETIDIDLAAEILPQQDLSLRISRPDGAMREIKVKSRIDTPIEVDYYKHGGILPFVLRELMSTERPAKANAA